MEQPKDAKGYDPEALEAKWQRLWFEKGLHKAVHTPGKPKFYIHFAYPGISGYLHVGHMRGFTYTDVVARYKRMMGFNVMFPVGTHGTGNQAISFANKVKKQDPRWIDYLRSNGCSDEEMKKLEQTQEVVRFFNEVYVNEYWKRFGFLADWDRFTCTVWPDYNKFIQWQFRKLNDLGYLAQKPYYATFCPNCGPVAVDPSETDISKGGKAEKHEYTLLKFKFGDEFVIAATLRPETVFGQTNFWADPKVEYAKVRVGKEIWIVSKPCAKKLKMQKEGIEEIGTIGGIELVGKMCKAPVVDRMIPILPSEFCDPNVGTGLVTSVPSDAPYDYQALMDIKKDRELQIKYHLDEKMIANLKPIPIIDTKGMGDTPAIKIVEEMKITDQHDPKLEEATKIIYKSGFHLGTMKSNCGNYAGMPVEEAKESVKKEMIDKGLADILHDLSEEVICRCGGQVLIKRIDDQWFIRYSDKDWTQKAKDYVEGMNINPRSYHDNLPGILDWFNDRACARLGNWLGTHFPLDEKWIIEPISDSTIYPAFYVVSSYTNSGQIKNESLTEAFFDFVYLGKGKAEEVAKATKVEVSLLKKVREDFQYWYPVDINLGGKEHQTVHFPVYVMNHVAIFPGNAWPKGILVNWWIVQKGGEGKISKSKGGAEPVPNAIKKFTVDALRLYYSHIASPFVDIEWDEANVLTYKQRLNWIWDMAHRAIDTIKMGHAANNTTDTLGKWLLSRAQGHLKGTDQAMKDQDIKAGSHGVFFSMVNDLDWYMKRGGEDPAVLKEFFNILIRAMAPFTPHLAEELWERFGNKPFVSTERFPEASDKHIDLKAELQEDLLIWLIDDIQHIIKVIKKKPERIRLYTSQSWRYKVWERALTAGPEVDTKAMMKELMADPVLRAKGGEVNKYIGQAMKDVKRIDEAHRSLALSVDELALYQHVKPFLEKKFECAFEVHSGEDPGAPDPQKKKDKGSPLKPAIAIE
jgi:leucyl-tRNA synthetase